MLGAYYTGRLEGAKSEEGVHKSKYAPLHRMIDRLSPLVVEVTIMPRQHEEETLRTRWWPLNQPAVVYAV